MKEQLNLAKEKMNKSLNALSNEFAAIRAGRANPGVLDKVMVDYYGAATPVNQMAAVSVSEYLLSSHGTSLHSSLSKRLSRLLISVSSL